MKRLLFAILLFPNILFGLTYSTHTIKQTGGDYATLALWYAGEAANLVTGDITAVAQIDGVWVSSEARNSTIDLYSFTTDITRRIHIYTETAARSTGTWDMSKYILTSKDPDGYGTIKLRVPHITIDGLQISIQTAGDNGSIFYSGIGDAAKTTPFDIQISNCILKNDNSAYQGSSWARAFDLDVGQSTGTCRFINNQVFNTGEGFYMASEVYGSTVAVYNNTFWNCNSASIRFASNNNKVVAYIKNNIVVSTCAKGTAYSASTTMIVSTQNITWDATSPNIPYRSMNPNFNNVFATFKNPNLFLVTTDTCAYQRGQDLRTDPDGICNITQDLAGNAKTATPSMGALDYQPSAAPTQTIYRYFRSTWWK